MEEGNKPRRIRSFVRRTGRMTSGQEQALREFWSDWGLEREAGLLFPEQVYGRMAPLVLEIGFGMGESLAQMARAQADTNFLGIEVHKPGIGRLFAELDKQGLANVRTYCDDAVAVLEQCLADASLDGVQIFFPDPWQKKRHHKRRLIQPEFVALLGRKMRPGAWLHLATDWRNYAENMLQVLDAVPGFVNQCGRGEYSPRPETRPFTRFEQRGQRLGHGVWDLLYTRR